MVMCGLVPGIRAISDVRPGVGWQALELDIWCLDDLLDDVDVAHLFASIRWFRR